MTVSSAIPVAVHGFTWTGALVGLLNLLVGGALVAIIKKWPELKRIVNERAAADDAATTRLLEQQAMVIERQDKRIDEIERQAAVERHECNAKIDMMQKEYQADHSVARHKMNNLDQCLTMLLTLIEENPEKAQSAAKRVREMRERQERDEAAEKGHIHAAKIAAVAPAALTPPAV